MLLPSQPRFRSMWERYCRGVQAIVFVVDSSDVDLLDQVRYLTPSAEPQAV